MCFWLQRGAHFCKNMKAKCMTSKISSKSHLTNCIFDAYSYQDPSRIVFFHLTRQRLVFFENQKNQVGASFGAAGRNAQGRWGRLWGGSEICKMWSAISELCFRFDTPALVYDKGGGFNRYAHCAGPALGPLQKSFKNQYFFNIFAFRLQQARTYTHHTCHLKLFDVELAQIKL